MILTAALNSPPALLALALFVIAYVCVILEEVIQMRKSKPVLIAAGCIWALVALCAQGREQTALVMPAIQHALLDYVELLLFLLVTMTYVNVIEERGVFQLIRHGFMKIQMTYKQLFWGTGILAFFLSPLIDNLATALVMGSIVLVLGKENKKFVRLTCIQLVVAANAGGAFSPFGDITTLMVWQKGNIPFHEFFRLFLPAVINFLIPAFCLHCALPTGYPSARIQADPLKSGAVWILLAFILTLVTAVTFHAYLHLPPVIGMMLGLGYLLLMCYFFKRRTSEKAELELDPLHAIQKIEWDTLLFFYGVILCVGGLATFGFLETASHYLYASGNPTLANSLIGILSALLDNIPLMVAVLNMDPALSEGQWLLLTLTTGVGGSLLSVGSAAGVALMGQNQGAYTFLSHLKWTWAIFIGYVASIVCHLWWNADFFH